MVLIGLVSFGLAALAFAGLTLLLAINRRRRRMMRWLLLACAGTLVWALVALALIVAALSPERWLWGLDAFHSAVWLLFLASLLPAEGVRSLRTLLRAAALLALAALGLAPLVGLHPSAVPAVPVAVLLGLSLLGLFGIEHLYRNADPHQRRVLGPLCLAIGALFAFDLFVYSHGLLLMQLDPALWLSRGLVNAIIVLPLLVGIKRHPELAPDLVVSRRVAFHSATLIGVGLYLIAMAGGGWLIRVTGGEWGPVLQATFLLAAVLLLAYILASSRLRAALRVFLAKHFYRYKYDYRDEWLRLIATLSDQDGGSAPQRALKALADILHSDTGQLWVSRAPGEPYEPMAAFGPGGHAGYAQEHPLVRYLARTNWIVDTEEYRRDPELYEHALREVEAAELAAPAVIVPMRHEGRLFGFARLVRPPGLGALNYEDHDLLKTVGRQMAVFVAQELARDQLAETRQFEAFNRMTAFLMHDLKNLLAQQALIVQNAPRHKHRPEFVDDAIATIDRSVGRMRRLLEQLRSGTAVPASTRVNLTPVLEEVVAEARTHTPVPELEIGDYCEVRGDRDKLAMILSHAVRNAQDATPADGRVRVRLARDADEVRIEIEDSGSGMDEAFVRERLFRPFDTTKGASGMGIGAYQIREYVQGLGGRVDVHSRPGEGTRLVLAIPAGTGEASGLYRRPTLLDGADAAGGG